ncbi:MAG: TetR family transcriptional regulator [Corynebacterium sp.]|nr:TetR family transcriptional regulator [Corynebacterium sp.]
MQLSQAAIITASIEILDEYGLADMTMRRLATHLGVAPGALYWHFENKQALIAAAARHLVSELLARPRVEDSNDEFVQRCADLRATMWSHRDGGELVSAAMTNDKLRGELVAFLSAGFRPQTPTEIAETAAETALHFLLGSTVIAQTQAQLAAASGSSQGPEHTATKFFQGIQLIISGVTRETD